MQKPKIPNNKTKKTQPQTSNQHFKHDSKPKICKTLKKRFQSPSFPYLGKATVKGNPKRKGHHNLKLLKELKT